MTGAPTSSHMDRALVASWVAAGRRVILIELVEVKGSSPREAGAQMAVTADSVSGTIGGGALEWALVGEARDRLSTAASSTGTGTGIDPALTTHALGPEIGQCCGGRVTARLSLVNEAEDLPAVEGSSPPQVLIFGAGHVGAALTRALALLPVTLTIVDERPEWLAPLRSFGSLCNSPLPEAVLASARPRSAFIVATHSHAQDFMIVEAALRRGDAAYVGMIGSASKRSALLRQLARTGTNGECLTCPIGAGVTDDKRPELIAAATVPEIVKALFNTA